MINTAHNKIKSSHSQGFTLLELMAVVIIIGILAVVAIPTYRHYIIQSRAQEALTYLPQISLRQQAYFMEFQSYLTAPRNPDDSKYSSLCNGGQALWDATVIDWQNLGFHPPNPGVYFQYWASAGSGTLPSASNNDHTCYGQIDVAKHYPPGTGSNWFTICARGDLLGKTCSATDPAMVFGISNAPTYNRVIYDLKRK
jgi:prepilin-type N-terminal cleavage/methylation domain-containing protein